MSTQTSPSRLRRFAVACAVYGAITVITLVLVDLVLIALGLFPPRVNFGDAELGWVGAPATGAMTEQVCFDFTAGVPVTTIRNENGLRTSRPAALFLGTDSLYSIAVSGDSQTELCAPNDSTHFGFLERDLRIAGVPAATFAGGAGKYSPLQAYLAVRRYFPEYSPDALVLNIYTGNDFYDMLRVDDRPHFVPQGDGFQIAPPVWYQETPPGTVRRSRVLFALRSIAEATGLRNAWVRVRYLSDVADARGEGFGTVVRYMNDLRKAIAPEVGYSAAFAAQILNQQLFFHRFPGSREESLVRVRALLEMIRTQNPEMTLVLSAIPSYQLAPGDSVATAYLRLFEKLPLTFEESVAEELLLYDSLREIAEDEGWFFVDNLPLLQEYEGEVQLYNSYDYHLTPPASERVGGAQAAAILESIGQESHVQ